MTTVSNSTVSTAAKLYCPHCTRTVDGEVVRSAKRRYQAKPGQRCSHCKSSLDAAYVLAN